MSEPTTNVPQTSLFDIVKASKIATSQLSVGVNPATITASTYTIDLSQTVTIFDGTNNAITATLPNGVSVGQVIVLINVAISGNTVNLNGEFLDGESFSNVQVSTTNSYFWSGSLWFPLSSWQWD